MKKLSKKEEKRINGGYAPRNFNGNQRPGYQSFSQMVATDVQKNPMAYVSSPKPN